MGFSSSVGQGARERAPFARRGRSKRRDVTLLTVALAALLAGSARCCNDPDAGNFGDVGDDCVFYGCTNKNAVNYDPIATTESGTCEFSSCPSFKLDQDLGDCDLKGRCCFDEDADNFVPDVYRYIKHINKIIGMTKAGQGGGRTYAELDCNLNSDGIPDSLTTPENKACEYSGCTNPLATNYNDIANVDDGTCIVRGCTDGTATN